MTTTRAFAVLLTGASVLALNSYAQEPAAAPVDVASASEEVIVTGQIVYRNRVDTPAPVLTYGLDYFQRFEPLTVGGRIRMHHRAAARRFDVRHASSGGAGLLHLPGHRERLPRVQG